MRSPERDNRKASFLLAAVQMLLRMRTTTMLVVVATACASTTCLATPVHQVLLRRSSSVAFGVTSPNPALSMNGSLRDFSGTVILDPSAVTNSQLSLSLALSSVKLPPDQVLQAVFLQTVLAKLPTKQTTFTSTKLEHVAGSRYMAHGTYSWLNKQRQATVPIEILRASPSLTEIRVVLDGSLHDSNASSAITQGIDGAHGWTKAVLIFSPSAG